MENEKESKIDKAIEEIQEIINKLEQEIQDKVEVNSYWGDIIKNGVESQGTKILITPLSDNI